MSCDWAQYALQIQPGCIVQCRVVSYGDLCMHFPPAGLPQLRDLRLFAQSLTSNLDYHGSAALSLAASLTRVCIATRQRATAVVLCQLLGQQGKGLQRKIISLPCSQATQARRQAQPGNRHCQQADAGQLAAGPGAEEWTWFVSEPKLEAWAHAQHLSTRRIFATYAAAAHSEANAGDGL